MDALIVGFDRALRALTGVATSARELPGGSELGELMGSARAEVAALMRVNHTGEVCAQALYQGQALLARDPAIAAVLQSSADEETEHLAWTAARLTELGGRTSILNPLFFVGAFGIGAFAAACGDRWSLGFLRETERQVVIHLQGHLDRLPDGDRKSRAVLRQMQADEARHAELAESLGAAELPGLVKVAMKVASRVMTGTASRV